MAIAWLTGLTALLIRATALVSTDQRIQLRFSKHIFEVRTISINPACFTVLTLQTETVVLFNCKAQT